MWPGNSHVRLKPEYRATSSSEVTRPLLTAPRVHSEKAVLPSASGYEQHVCIFFTGFGIVFECMLLFYTRLIHANPYGVLMEAAPPTTTMILPATFNLSQVNETFREVQQERLQAERKAKVNRLHVFHYFTMEYTHSFFFIVFEQLQQEVDAARARLREHRAFMRLEQEGCMHIKGNLCFFLTIFVQICLSIYLSIYPSVHPSLSLPLSLSPSVRKSVSGVDGDVGGLYVIVYGWC